MYHMFDVEVAKEVGIFAAILFHNIAFWCQHSQANGRNYHDGEYWTFNTNKAFCELFPYMSGKSIRNAIQKLIDAELIITGNFNEKPYDRTIWYTLSQKGKCMFQKGQMDLPVGANGIAQKGNPIPDINTYINTDINNNNIKGGTVRFVKPTIEELSAYALEIDYNLDPQAFLDYYDGNGWMVGKNHMKDWKAAVRTWKRRAIERGLNTHANRPEPNEPVITPEQAAEARRIIEAGGGWG